VYFKNTTSGYVIVCIYVDDMLIMGSNNDIIKATKRILNSKFAMKDLGVNEKLSPKSRPSRPMWVRLNPSNLYIY
jgi:hypothetical protein